MAMLTKNLRTIKIGHGAYSGANALKFVTSKAAAVRELRNRGLLRDQAREVVNSVCGRPNGYQIAEAGFDLIEVHAMNTDASWHGHF